MPRKSDEVEALAKVLWDASDHILWGSGQSRAWPDEVGLTARIRYRAMARAAIAHLSKPKRGAKRG